MKILVTGADGFVGSRLVPRLLGEGHEVLAGVHPAAGDARSRLGWPQSVRVIPLELPNQDSIRAGLAEPCHAVIHLAAVASGTDARRNPSLAWRVNAEGTALLAEELVGRARAGDRPLLLHVSTAEVYGAGAPVPRRETDPVAPTSPYAASKAAGEIAALEAWRRAGIRVVVVRPFPHTGPAQDERYVIPALAQRIRLARKQHAPAVMVGNLDVVRELMHVDDVVDAYVALLEHGEGGEVYNVATGQGLPLAALFDRLCELIGYRVRAEPDPSLMRTGDIPYLVGDPEKLRVATGWEPRRTLERTLQEVVDAQAD